LAASDLDALGLDLAPRFVLEHHGDPLIAALGPAVDLSDEAPGRTRPVAPPAVGPRTDHVHRIDNPVHLLQLKPGFPGGARAFSGTVRLRTGPYSRHKKQVARWRIEGPIRRVDAGAPTNAEGV
jgi:hypothetical protein